MFDQLHQSHRPFLGSNYVILHIDSYINDIKITKSYADVYRDEAFCIRVLVSILDQLPQGYRPLFSLRHPTHCNLSKCRKLLNLTETVYLDDRVDLARPNTNYFDPYSNVY